MPYRFIFSPFCAEVHQTKKAVPAQNRNRTFQEAPYTLPLKAIQNSPYSPLPPNPSNCRNPTFGHLFYWPSMVFGRTSLFSSQLRRGPFLSYAPKSLLPATPYAAASQNSAGPFSAFLRFSYAKTPKAFPPIVEI